MINMEHNKIFERSKTILCDDAVSTVLIRLPVKSLMRFTCVSKSWNSLIKSPSFIAAHSRYHKDPSSRYLLYMPKNTYRYSPFLTTAAEQRRSNLKPPFPRQLVVGSCEGLVCLQKKSRVCLWNPLLQIFKILPPSPYGKIIAKQKALERPRFKFGLGYSCKNNDHRIVKLIYTEGDKFSDKVEIYSLKYNSWKSVECSAPLLPYEDTSVFINGCINWLAFSSDEYLRTKSKIMWFDIDKELFGETKCTTQPWFIEFSSHEPEWIQFPFVKEVLRYAECEEYGRLNSSLWKMKTLACKNSWVHLWLDYDRKKVPSVAMFDGELLLDTDCKNLISFLGFNVDVMKNDPEYIVPWYQRLLVVCVSESLMLLDQSDVIHCRK